MDDLSDTEVEVEAMVEDQFDTEAEVAVVDPSDTELGTDRQVTSDSSLAKTAKTDRN